MEPNSNHDTLMDEHFSVMSYSCDVDRKETANGCGASTTSKLQGVQTSKRHINAVGERSEDEPGPNTMFTVNRYVQFFIMLLYSGCVGCHFFNWVPWEQIFSMNVSFAEGCLAENGTWDGSEKCEQFIKTTDRMFLIFQASMYSFSFVAGMVFDIVGPKLCSIIGNLLLIAGWAILCVCSAKYPFYEVAVTVIGAGTDAAFLGTMGTSNMFPHHSSLVIAFLRAARSLSNGFPVILKRLSVRWPNVFDLHGISLLFIVLYIYCLIIAFFFIPSKIQHPRDAEVTMDEQNPGTNNGSVRNSSFGDCHREYSDALNSGTGGTKGAILMDVREHLCVEEIRHVSGGLRTEGLKRRAKDAGSKTCTGILYFSSRFQSSTLSHVIENVQRGASVLRHELCILKRHVKSLLYFPVIFIAVSNLLRNDYYVLSAKHRLGSAQETLTIINAMLLIPGPICGYFVSLWGPFVVMNGLNLLMGLAFGCTILAGIVISEYLKSFLRHASVFLVFPSLGFSMTQIYCYVALVFDPCDLGKLTGFASLVAGLACLLTQFMTGANVGTMGFILRDAVGLMITLVTISITFFLMWRLAVKRRLNSSTPCTCHDSLD